MNLQQIETFVRVAEAGSFSKAAVLLDMAQPALSRQVRALETELRETLLIRTGRGVQPTDAGRRLLEHGHAILQRVALAKEDLGALRDEPVGRITVGLPPSMARCLTLPLIEAFARTMPKARLALVEGFSVNIAEWLATGRIDLGLAGGKQDQHAAAFGGFNFMEFQAGERVIVNPLRIKDWVAAELEASLLLYFTGVSRESARIIDEQSRNAASGASRSLEAMHQLKAEAVQMKENLLRGDLGAFARTLQQGWEAKKRMASSISNPMIDGLEAVAMANGAVATKVSGAGGGGFMMFVCDPVDRIRLAAALSTQGGSLLDFHFNPGGATAWRTP